MAAYQGPIFRVERRDGRDVVVHGPAVAIVAVELVRVPLDEVPGLVGEVEDSKTLAGLLFLSRL